MKIKLPAVFGVFILSFVTGVQLGKYAQKAIKKAPANRCDSHVILRCSLRTPCNVSMQASPYIASCAAGDALFSQCVHNALEAHGAVAVSHIPGLASAREMALRSVSRCLVSTCLLYTSDAADE